jgi:hypothetical protein
MTGVPAGDTYLPQLAHALAAFGVPSAPLYAADGGGDPLAAVEVALAQGRPVIVTLGGAALGRGASYGDHFVVVIGMTPRASLVDVLDPDTQAPGSAQWLPGGRQQWPAAVVRAGIAAAQERDALGVVAGAKRVAAVPSWPFLVAAGLSVMAGVLYRRVHMRHFCHTPRTAPS